MEKKINKFTPNEISEDKKISLRPKKITEFVGQDNIKSNLKTFIESSIKTKMWVSIADPHFCLRIKQSFI